MCQKWHLDSEELGLRVQRDSEMVCGGNLILEGRMPIKEEKKKKETRFMSRREHGK